MSSSPRRHAAWHEAGHAAMALATGLPVRYVAIGRFAAPYAGIVVSLGAMELRRSFHGLDSLALALIAGGLAERIYAGDAHRPDGTDADREGLIAIAQERGFRTRRARNHYLARQSACAVTILTRLRNWQPVEALAEALLERERLVEEEVRALFDTARHRAIAYPDALLHRALAGARRRLLGEHGAWPGLARTPDAPAALLAPALPAHT